MTLDEKTQLLALLAHEGKWSRDAEARDADGRPVRYDDDTAIAWDLTGALCVLFGWRRACELFAQMERHLLGKRRTFVLPMHDISIDAMKSLLDFNDRDDTTFDLLRERIETMPVWKSRVRADAAVKE